MNELNDEYEGDFCLGEFVTTIARKIYENIINDGKCSNHQLQCQCYFHLPSF